MKYSQLVADSYSDMVGTIDIMGQNVQLCDHMENLNGQYYATSFALSADDRKMLKDNGAEFGSLGEDLSAVYLPTNLLQQAKPARDGDSETKAMIERLMIGLSSANMTVNAFNA